MLIEEKTKKDLTPTDAYKLAVKLNKKSPDKNNTIFIDQPEVADLYIADNGKIRRCTDQEWAKFYNQHLK